MQIACCPYGFWPELYRPIGIPHHTSCLGIQGSDHSFSCSILVLGVWRGGFKSDSFFSQHSQDYRVAEFCKSIVALESFDVEPLGFNPGLIGTKLG